MIVGIGGMCIGIGGGIAVGIIGVGSGLFGILRLWGVLSELDVAIDLPQIVLVVVRGAGAATTRCRCGFGLRPTAEGVPEDEADHGDEQNDDRPDGFGQDSDQTTIAQKAIEESVQCDCCRKYDRGNEYSSHASRIVH